MTRSQRVLTFIILLLPVLLLALYSFFQTRNQLIRQVYDERKNLATISARMLHEKLDRLSEIGNSFANWPTFRQSFDEPKWNHVTELMKTITRDFPYISNVFITDTAGTVMTAIVKAGGTRADRRNFPKWYGGVSKNWQPYLSEVYNYPDNPGQITSALAIPLNNMAGKLSGVLVLEVNINKLLEWSNGIDIGSNGFVYIVDQKGNIAINPNYSQSTAVIDYSSVPAVQKALQGKKDAEVLYNPVTKDRSLCAYEQVPFYGWAVIVQEEAGTALSVNHSIRTVLIFYVSFILLAIFFIWVILRGLIRQQKAAQELKKKDDNIHLLVDNVKDYAIFMLDKNGLVTNWNLGAKQIKGYTAKEILGQSLEKFYTEADIKKGLPAQDLAVASQEGQLESEGWRVKKDGSLFWANTVITSLRDENGESYGYSIITRDITEKKKTQEQLEMLYRQINQSNEAIYTVDAERKVLSWNRGAEELYGYAKEEVLGREVMQLLNTSLTKEELDEMMQTVSDKNFLRKELRRKTKSGNDVFVHTSSSAIRDEQGKITGYLIVNVDVTERKKLMEEVNYLASIVEQSSEAIVSRGADKRLKSWNKGAEKLFGYSKEEAIGKLGTELGFVRLAPAERTALENDLAEKGIQQTERQYFHKNGSSFIGAVTATAVKDEKGNIVSVVFIIKDISLSKQLEAQLKTANEQLEQKVIERTEQIYRSEQQYRYLFENNPLPMWVLDDVTFKFLDVNEIAIQHYGYSRDEFLSMTVFDIRPAADRDLLKRLHFNGESKAGYVNKGTWTHLKKDGSMMQVEVISHEINFQSKKARLILANDVTEKILTEEKLQASELRYRSLIENSVEGISLLNEKGDVIYRSPSGEKLLGYGSKKAVIDFAHPDNLDMFRNKFAESLLNPGVPVPYRVQYHHPEKRYFFAEGTFTNLLHIKGVNAVVANYHDVTEKIAAEEKLQASEKRFRALIEKNFDVIIVFDRSLKITYRSPSATAVTGRNDDETMGNIATSNIHPEDLPALQQELGQLMKQAGGSADALFRYQRKGGQHIWLEGTATNLLDDENVRGVICNFRDVTKRKEAEEKLVASEEHFRTLIENNHDVINLVDESLNVIYRSPSAQRITGLTDEDILHKSIQRSIHPDEREIAAALIKETFANPGKPIPCKIRSRHKKGHYLWLEGTITNLLHYRYVNAVLLNFRDVTERVEYEEKLKEQKAQLQTLGDNLTGVMIYQLVGEADGTRTFTYVSNGVTKLTGKTPQEVMADPAILYNMILEEDQPGLIAAEMKSGRQMTVFSREVRCRTYNDEIRWLKIVSTPRIQPNGQVVWDGFHIDITEQKNAVQKVADSEARLRALIENNTDAIVLNDSESNIIYQSPSVSKILGYELIERKNTKSLDYVHPEYRDEFISLFEKLRVIPNQPLPFQYRFLHKNGHYVWLEGVVTNLMDDPIVNAYVANYRDVTERKEAEENIKQLNEDLEIKIQQRTEQLKKTNEELEAFSYSISHDLRAPLRGIIGFTSILEEEYSSQLDDEAKRITAIIKNNTLKMGNLIDDLLSFSRTGRHDIEKIVINSNALVKEIIAGIEQKNTGPVIEWVLPSLHQAYADATTIRQVWINLLNNAVKYSSQQDRPRIETGSYTRDAEVVFFVKDNGVGFDQKYTAKLFKVFQRLHNSSEFEGTGVGLAIVEKIISKHGGRVWAAAEKGKGACFYFSLPDENTFIV